MCAVQTRLANEDRKGFRDAPSSLTVLLFKTLLICFIHCLQVLHALCLEGFYGELGILSGAKMYVLLPKPLNINIILSLDA